jgi:hypothetical protein
VWRQQDFEEPKRTEVELHARAELIKEVDFEAILLEEYEITNDEKDTVPFDELYDYLKSNGVQDTMTKVGRSLTALKLPILTKKIDKKTVKCRGGIKRRV